MTPKHGDFLYYLKHDFSKKLKITYVGASFDQEQRFPNERFIKMPKTKQIYLKDNEQVYVSLDVDCLIHDEMTSTGCPRSAGSDGLTCAEIIEYLTHLPNRVNIVGADLVEFGVHPPVGRIKNDDLERAKSLFLALEKALVANKIKGKECE